MPSFDFSGAVPRVGPLLAASAMAAMIAGPAAAASGVTIELNRLEQSGAACRVSLVVANPGEKTFDSLKLDLVFFDKDGVIAKRLAVEAGPVRASKTSVKLFDAAETSCEGLSRVLLNDVTSCGGEQDCQALVSTSSRVKSVEFGK